MARIFLLLMIFAFIINHFIHTQETDYDEYLDFGSTEGITFYSEFPIDSIEADILGNLNSSYSDRKQFIEDTLLDRSGFLRTANAKYRNSNTSEKFLSVLHGFSHAFSLGYVPMKPLLEIEYDRLPKGEYYSFESVILSSDLKYISADVLSVMELEYILQIEFRNGIVLEDNRKYYSQENIDKFESLIFKLPDSPESIRKIKDRFINIELPKIKNAVDRYDNPSENYLRAVNNLNFDIFKKK